ncbi:hypothetical protein TWF569_011057 [Orbilia oligospora]|uniref:Uncharacterized protein n=1 Tax=Orbilia oligospora TaxID=2813651 RepID=A0A7C8N2F6_ORBOL|nr:hypothetical protein TWF102_003260 [Orbilia oligospora]KAF3094072.1 hypothetical protein TWF706_008611 [Orbilia oligospora]KAF3096065.1 hypothetical protein TWF103_009966 [Orbilia oligospora]KAF3131895.1 hypothetical protein TWF569_011057 [Orbilia oligospora]
MSLKNDAFPASAAFDSIAAALKDETEKKDAIKKVSPHPSTYTYIYTCTYMCRYILNLNKILMIVTYAGWSCLLFHFEERCGSDRLLVHRSQANRSRWQGRGPIRWESRQFVLLFPPPRKLRNTYQFK